MVKVLCGSCARSEELSVEERVEIAEYLGEKLGFRRKVIYCEECDKRIVLIDNVITTVEQEERYLQWLTQQSKSPYLKRADREHYTRLLNEFTQSDAKRVNAK